MDGIMIDMAGMELGLGCTELRNLGGMDRFLTWVLICYTVQGFLGVWGLFSLCLICLLYPMRGELPPLTVHLIPIQYPIVTCKI